jgi:hypothetical protein
MISALLEQFATTLHGRLRIFSQDVCTPSVRYVPHFHLATMPFAVVRANGLEQRGATLDDVIEVDEAGLDTRHDPPQVALAIEQRAIAEIVPIDAQGVEGDEVRPIAAEEQIVEPAAAVGRQADDLTIKHRVVCANAMRDFLREQAEFRQHEAAARHELEDVAADVRERAESIVFSSKEPIGMVERLRDGNERHRPEDHG